MTAVADPVGRIGSASDRPERKPHDPISSITKARLAAAGCWFMATIGIAAPALGAATEFVVPGGPVITLQDGRVVDGHIVGIDQTNVVIQSADGSTETLPRATVDRVAFETVTGDELAGELVGWSPGIYQITTAEAAIKVYSTMPRVAQAPEPVETAAAELNANDAGQGGSETAPALTVDETTDAADDEGSTDVDAVQNAAVTPTSNLSIAVTVENSSENGPPVAFNIKLSEPSEASVVLIYATIDGTAINGQDYEANRGVVVIKPGEQDARIEAQVIDDGEQEDQEHLQLFLTVDPTVAVVENRQIIATIDDDDQG